ncbi:MAG TPA: hypothetical protein PKD46_17750, partial [Aggregatilineaceae bacterium]|nr:hypothetical protein [Aggregatilineaceae bacterium]
MTEQPAKNNNKAAKNSEERANRSSLLFSVPGRSSLLLAVCSYACPAASRAGRTWRSATHSPLA